MSKESIERLEAAMSPVTERVILLVEDDDCDALLAKHVLDERPCHFHWVKTAEEAREAAATGQFMICLLDLKLPDSVRPVDLVESIQAANPAMKIALLTGTLTDDIEKALKWRALSVIIKPLTAAKLEDLLK